ncbi:rCG55851 [Rattus norvegicus]|uniref:RCG55851 n=1 Tax=Rattus norvegicus TaxID=10116 RepID=A6JLW0_RAT|nr:rCG55851 [Rattus norvegicus]
MIYFELES